MYNNFLSQQKLKTELKRMKVVAFKEVPTA